MWFCMESEAAWSWKLARKAGLRGSRSCAGLNEPLLDDESSPLIGEDRHEQHHSKALVPLSVNRMDWEELRRRLSAACSSGWSSLMATISNCLATVLVQPKARHVLSDQQKQRLEGLQRRIKVSFDKEDLSHQEALKQLWGYAFPGETCKALQDAKWKEMGWQQSDPSTDFRGAGFIALENLLYLAQHEESLFQTLLHKTNGTRSDWEYPFAVAGVNLTFTLQGLLDLRRRDGSVILHTPDTEAGRAFLTLLEDDANAFDEIYCLAFEMLDRTWLEMGASYMEFTPVINRVKSHLQAALASNPRSMEGLKILTRP